jgi:outer membrane protein OmpA-like peptidoglycan-associated protein
VIKVKILVFILLLSTSVFSQLTSEERNNTVADCENAIEIIHFKQANIQFTGSYGYLDELSDINSGLVEQNSVWLKFSPQVNGSMTIDFHPIDDFNFEYYLFIDSLGDFRTNEYESEKSELLIEQGDFVFNENRKSNPISPIKLAFNTKSTVSYYLLLHSKEVHQKSLKINFFLDGDKNVETIYIQNFKSNKNQKALTIRLRDKQTKAGILANITILGLKVDNQLFMGSDFIFDAYYSRGAEISVNAEGYFLNTSIHKIVTTNDTEIIIELEPLAVGKKLKLEGIRYITNSKELSPISYVALKRLLDFMILNSSIEIEIQGHVNAPGGDKTSMKAKKLSESRAKKAYLYLVQNGIDKKRVTFVGMGATEMIHPKPKNHDEEELNRRVEFLITQ